MNKKQIMYGMGIMFLVVTIVSSLVFVNKQDAATSKLQGKILSVAGGELTVQDKENIIYTFNVDDINAEIGDDVLIEYTGLLDKNKSMQDNAVIHYTNMAASTDENGIPSDWLDNGIFKDYYAVAKKQLDKLTLDEKIGQLFLVRHPDTNAAELLKKYNFGGYVFFERDFKNKTEQQVTNMIKDLQKSANTPILTAVDEEGGKVVRVSSNPNLVSAPFKSSQQLYQMGGFEQIKQDTIYKSKVLSHLGLNLNLAPVVDVSVNPNDYMYERSFGSGTELTSTYAKTVIESSKDTGVSYTLKHFPGYGNNADTHTGSSVDQRSYDDILNNDLPPFEVGIKAGAEAVLVSHNTVTSIDASNPASLSASVHNLLRNKLNFTGIIITDDLDMGAISSISDATVKAILAGNDLIITTDYEDSVNQVKKALQNGTISEDLIDKLAFRILSWKYYKGIMFQNQK